MKTVELTVNEIVTLLGAVSTELHQIDNLIDEEETTDELQKQLNAMFKERREELEKIYDKLVNA